MRMTKSLMKLPMILEVSREILHKVFRMMSSMTRSRRKIIASLLCRQIRKTKDFKLMDLAKIIYNLKMNTTTISVHLKVVEAV